MKENSVEPIVTFYQLYPMAPTPCRADPGMFGSMPARALHYCEPFTAATGFGWHLFPPLDFDLLWDGAIVRWKATVAREWERLDGADLPGFRGLWALHAPIVDVLPSPSLFLYASPGEPGLVSVWTGLLARTAPDWSLLIRRPANILQDQGYEVLEGIIETDWWFGPIHTVIRLRKTDEPIPFRTTIPLIQAQPVSQRAYAEDLLSSMIAKQGLSALSERDWQAYTDTVLPRNTPGARLGRYKATVRQRRKAKNASTS